MSDNSNDNEVLRAPCSGRQLLGDPLFNKGTAFTAEERVELGMEGLLPSRVSSLEEQLQRCYQAYQEKHTDLERHIYLRALQDRNETLFHALVVRHLVEMLPIIYTPTVGEACQRFSHIYRRTRGCFVTWPERDAMDRVLDNGACGRDVEIIVVTDAERILGLGDQGAGGMGIPIGKLALYSVCGGIEPATTLPILLDVGTDNAERLADPLYIGWSHPRLRGEQYDTFIEQFVEAVIRRFPKAILQWEDFANANASRLLERYRDRLCTFNDDIQGTASVTLGALLSAAKIAGLPLSQQRVVIFGAGSAGCGIAKQLVLAMVEEGLDQEEAHSRIYLIDSKGLMTDAAATPAPTQQPFLRPVGELQAWGEDGVGQIRLEQVVRQVHPTILIGVSGQGGAFSETAIREMAAHVEHPVIFPLSNPTSKAEASPEWLMEWTDGRAVIATGSPFPDLEQRGMMRPVAQCNNAYIFPGVGLGVLAVEATRITDSMFTAAAKALAAFPKEDPDAVLPALEQIREVSEAIALAVARCAVAEGHGDWLADSDIEERIRERLWEPRYRSIRLG